MAYPRLAYRPPICSECHRVIPRHPQESAGKHAGRKTCSPRCAALLSRRRHAEARRARETRHCKHCGATMRYLGGEAFSVFAARMFCSRECRRLGQRQVIRNRQAGHRCADRDCLYPLTDPAQAYCGPEDNPSCWRRRRTAA